MTYWWENIKFHSVLSTGSRPDFAYGFDIRILRSLLILRQIIMMRSLDSWRNGYVYVHYISEKKEIRRTFCAKLWTFPLALYRRCAISWCHFHFSFWNRNTNRLIEYWKWFNIYYFLVLFITFNVIYWLLFPIFFFLLFVFVSILFCYFSQCFSTLISNTRTILTQFPTNITILLLCWALENVHLKYCNQLLSVIKI